MQTELPPLTVQEFIQDQLIEAVKDIEFMQSQLESSIKRITQLETKLLMMENDKNTLAMVNNRLQQMPTWVDETFEDMLERED